MLFKAIDIVMLVFILRNWGWDPRELKVGREPEPSRRG